MADYWRYHDRLNAAQLLTKRPRAELDDTFLQGPAGYGRGELRYEERDPRLLEFGVDYGKGGAGYGAGVLGADITGLGDGTLLGASAARTPGLGLSGLDDLRLSGLDPVPLKGSGARLTPGRADILRQDIPFGRTGYRPLPADAAPTLFVEGIPAECGKREVAHIFRPFRGYKEVRLVHKESKRSGRESSVLCFVEFEDPQCAAKALDSLQGYRLDEDDRDSEPLRLQFARAAGPRIGRDRDFPRGRY